MGFKVEYNSNVDVKKTNIHIWKVNIYIVIFEYLKDQIYLCYIDMRFKSTTNIYAGWHIMFYWYINTLIHFLFIGLGMGK